MNKKEQIVAIKAAIIRQKDSRSRLLSLVAGLDREINGLLREKATLLGMEE